MTPELCREKWNFLPEYPMLAATCAAARPEFAKQMGFGQQRRPGRAPG
jgi:predicted transcriptional regulator